MADLVIRGGSVADGSGAEPVRADVTVSDGRISAVGEVGHAGGATVIDAGGRLVLPGFIDCHVHTDGFGFDPQVQHVALRQGVTSWILGQDGLSFAPASPATQDFAARYFAAVNGPVPRQFAGGCGVDRLLRGYDGAAALNVGYLVPAGTVRADVVGLEDRPPMPAETAAMQAIVATGMHEGALGLSSGLDYIPGRFAAADELAALARPAAAAGGIYVTHMRGYESAAPAAVAEVCQIARTATVSAHISHYHGPGELLAGLIDGARASGVDVTFDSYPYTRANSILAMVALPAWVQEGGTEVTVGRLRDPAVRRRLAGPDWFGGAGFAPFWERVTIASAANPRWTWTEGMPILAVAARAGRPVEDVVCDLVADCDVAVGCVFSQPHSGDADVRRLLRHDAQMAGSDGIPAGGHPHPRFWGTFARLLGHHTRDLGDWTPGAAAVHLAGRPAARFGIGRRGLVRAGYVADLAVADLESVRDRATYDDPRALATGVDDVVVSGVPVLRGGELTGALPGRGLRLQRSSP